MDLCTGIGGFSLGLKLVGGVRTVCYVEWDGYCQQLIQQRISGGHLDDAPIWGDLRQFDGKPWRGSVDLITAGFPCQPFSVAGNQQGEADERNLWPDIARVIREVRPRFVFMENVPALLTHSKYFGTILGDLATCGYDVRWDCISAASVGANHQRDRLWILADTTSTRQPRQGQPVEWGGQAAQGEGQADNAFTVRESYQWPAEPNMGRVAHGVSRRVDRLKGLGNAVVPAVVARAWRELT